jgi:hypothetical protein
MVGVWVMVEVSVMVAVSVVSGALPDWQPATSPRISMQRVVSRSG